MQPTPPREVNVPTLNGLLYGLYTAPIQHKGLVFVLDGTGCSRTNSLTNSLVESLTNAGYGTLQMNLLTYDEDRRLDPRNDHELMGQRILSAYRCARDEETCKDAPIALVAIGVAAASALQTASTLGSEISAVVALVGRPDKAGASLENVKCPVRFVVSEEEGDMLAVNQAAMAALPDGVDHDLVTVAHWVRQEECLEAREDALQSVKEWVEKYLP